MNNLIDSVKRTFGQGRSPAQQLTRAQARKLIMKRIDPLIKQEGFVHRKGNNLWRITENKTDVIELRFLTMEEHQQFKIPESTFSINYGCYYHFIPDIYQGKFVHQIPELITPREVDCHYRDQATRSIKQQPKKMDMSAWHLDEPEDGQQLVLDDVATQLKAEVFPTLNRLKDLDQWLKVLESEAPNLGTGNTNSVMRYFLLGFTYEKLGNNQQAKNYLIKAKGLSENQNKKLAKHLANVSPDAPLFTQAKIINDALTDLEKQAT